MKKSLFVVMNLILALTQITVTWRLGIGWHNLGLALSGIIVLSVFDIKSAYISAFLNGFFLDCIQGRLLFLYLLSYIACVVFIHFVSKMMNKRCLMAVIILTFILSFAVEFLQYLILPQGNSSISFILTKIIFPQVFYNLTCSFLIYFLYKKLWKKLKIEKERWYY